MRSKTDRPHITENGFLETVNIPILKTKEKTMSGCAYTIYILATPKQGGHPFVDIRISSSSYSLLEWLNKFLPNSKHDSDRDPILLRTQYETRTLDVSKDIVSESMYDLLIRIFLKAYLWKTDPSSIAITEVHGKTFLESKKTEQTAATGEDKTEEVGMPLVDLASEMLENKEYIDWKKDSVHIWITNEFVIF